MFSPSDRNRWLWRSGSLVIVAVLLGAVGPVSDSAQAELAEPEPTLSPGSGPPDDGDPWIDEGIEHLVINRNSNEASGTMGETVGTDTVTTTQALTWVVESVQLFLVGR